MVTAVLRHKYAGFALNRFLLRDDGLNHSRRLNASQLHVQSLELVCEVVMIDPQLVQHCGVHVTHMDDIVYCVVAKIIGGSVTLSGFDSSPGHPH